VIDLDSLGGNAEWALEIARKIKELGKTTQLRLRHYLRRRARTDGRRGEGHANRWRWLRHPVLRATFYPRRREIAASPR
jgi:hypothetical protein